MSNRFCIILNEGNNVLTLTTPSQDKVYRLRQGHLFIGSHTPYDAYNINSESWHIIGHIDNLPLLNYLLYSYYPSQNDVISKEIICLAVKRYGMKILELLQGNFCIIYEDAEGNLTVVTEDETQRGGAFKAANDAEDGDGAPRAATDMLLHQAGTLLSISRTSAEKQSTQGVTTCRYPQQSYDIQRKIAITRWQDNHLQFIQIWSHPVHCDEQTGATNDINVVSEINAKNDIKGKVVDLEKYSFSSN